MFDAILLASYGAPESIADIEPFLNRALMGKRIPETRRNAVRERYMKFNGKSPLHGECRQFLKDLTQSISTLSTPPKLYWGNFYTSPSFEEAFAQIERDAIQNLLVFPSSAFGSLQSCRRYRDAVRRAFSVCSPEFQATCKIVQTVPFFETEEFVRATADALLTAVAWDDLNNVSFSQERSNDNKPTRLLLFTAHSLPTIDGEKSQYRRQLLKAINAVLHKIEGFKENKLEGNELPSFLREDLRKRSFEVKLAFQSRSGAPSIPWLEPNAIDVARLVKKENPKLKSVIVIPIGFFFENMETIYDLDVELREACEQQEMTYSRAKCSGTSKAFIELVTKLSQRNVEDFPICPCEPGICDLSCLKTPL